MVKQQPASRTMGCAWIGQQQQPLRARMRSRPPRSSRSSPTDAPPSNPSAAATPMQPSTIPAASAPPSTPSLPRRLATAACALWASAGGGFVLPLSGPAGHSLHPPAAIAATTTTTTTTTTTMLPPLPQLSSAAAPSSGPLPMLLVAGVAADSDAKPAVLLLPIAKVEAAIDEIGELIKDAEGPGWQQALDTLSQAPFDKAQFKKIFNAYADTIYRPTSFNGYTDTPPSSQQSIQYLYRNEILTNLEELREELSYLIQERAKGSAGDWQDQSGLRDYWGRAKAAMNKYLSLAPADDVQGVREAVANQRRQQREQQPKQP